MTEVEDSDVQKINTGKTFIPILTLKIKVIEKRISQSAKNEIPVS